MSLTPEELAVIERQIEMFSYCDALSAHRLCESHRALQAELDTTRNALAVAHERLMERVA